MLRRSLKTPIPEFARAADLLSAAADALLAGDLKICGVLLVKADLALSVAMPTSFFRAMGLPQLAAAKA